MEKETCDNRRKRVLYMVSWYFSAVEENPVGVFHTQATLDLQRYCDVAIYYPYEREISSVYISRNELGILTYRSKYKLEKKIANRVNMFKTFKAINSEFKPDIIHAHVGTEAGRFAVMLGKIFNIPVIITEHSSADISGVRTFPHHMYAYFSYKGSKFNACVSDALTKDLREIFPKFKFETIYNGIEIPTVTEGAYSYRVGDYLNMVMVAGMYDRNIKGIPEVLKALKLIKDDGLEFAMHFVGTGEYQGEFEKMAEELGVAAECHFHGQLQRQEVFRCVSQMDFLISASRYESFGCSMAEATMLGTPVLSTDSGGSKSIVDADNGLFIDGYDSEAIASGIKKMIDSYKAINSKYPVERYINKFSIDTITSRYMKIYDDVINNGKVKR